jgi:hypothetical protein
MKQIKRDIYLRSDNLVLKRNRSYLKTALDKCAQKKINYNFRKRHQINYNDPNQDDVYDYKMDERDTISARKQSIKVAKTSNETKFLEILGNQSKICVRIERLSISMLKKSNIFFVKLELNSIIFINFLKIRS